MARKSKAKGKVKVKGPYTIKDDGTSGQWTFSVRFGGRKVEDVLDRWEAWLLARRLNAAYARGFEDGVAKGYDAGWDDAR